MILLNPIRENIRYPKGVPRLEIQDFRALGRFFALGP